MSGTRTLQLLAVCLLLAGCSASMGAVHEPISDAALRQTPLHFGMHVTPDPAQNPIRPPERFIGYHVGVDYEVSAEELETDVPVYAICNGTVAYSGFAEGYGGLLIQHCAVDDEPGTVLYGHLTIDGLPKVGVLLKPGDRVSVLAPARSFDSDGNRKHLHLGIHRGVALDYRGYVQKEEELKEFIDARIFFPPAISMTALKKDFTPYWQTGSGTTEQ